MRRSSFAIAAVVSLSGCALTDVTLGRPRSDAVGTSSQRGEKRDIVLLRPFGARRTASRCGMKKNGYNMDTASVLCGWPPEPMLADILTGELSRAGFNVLRDPRQAGPSTIVLTGIVDQLFVEPKLNFFTATLETDLAFRLTAKTASGLSADRVFYVKGEEATFFAGEEDMLRSLESAIHQLVLAVVGAVANLADSYPATAAPAVAPEAAPSDPAPSGTPEVKP